MMSNWDYWEGLIEKCLKSVFLNIFLWSEKDNRETLDTISIFF